MISNQMFEETRQVVQKLHALYGHVMEHGLLDVLRRLIQELELDRDQPDYKAELMQEKLERSRLEQENHRLQEKLFKAKAFEADCKAAILAIKAERKLIEELQQQLAKSHAELELVKKSAAARTNLLERVKK